MIFRHEPLGRDGWCHARACATLPRRWFCLILVGLLLAAGMCRDPSRTLGGELPAQSARTETEATRSQLVERHNELVPRIKKLWQQGEVEKAYEGLQELLVIYRDAYPPSKFPDGHTHIVRCYRDLCRLSEELGKTKALLRYSQDGLAMCRRLFTQDDFPHGHVMTVCMLANLGHAWSQNGYPGKARRQLLQSIQMEAELREHGSAGLAPESVAQLHVSTAKCCSLLGDIPQALHHAELAVKQCQNLTPTTSYLERLQVSARCFLVHGRTLISTGDYQAATDALKQSLDLSLRVFLTERSPDSRLALIDAHTTLGILHRHKSNLPKAKWHLAKARELGGEPLEQSECLARRLANVDRQARWIVELDTDPKVLGLAPSPFFQGNQQQTDYQGVVKNLLRFERLLRRGARCDRQREINVAEDAFQSARDICQKLSESHDIQEANPMGIWAALYLGRFYKNSGRYWKAIRHFSTSLSHAQEVHRSLSLSDRHPMVWLATHYTATQLWLLGETESAAALYREAMLMCERIYPAADYPRGHRRMMSAYSAWGTVLEFDGDYDGASTYYSKAHRIARAQFPEAEYPHGHDELASMWRSLGRLERARGHWDEALDYFRKALSSYRERYAGSFPEGHSLIAFTLSELGRTYHAAEDYGEAEEYLRRSLAMRRRLFATMDFPNGHPNLATALRDLGGLLHDSARYDEAFLLFMESARMEQAVAESFVGGGSEALLLNLAARKFNSLDFLLNTWCHTTRPAEDVYQYVWRRRGFVPRLIATRRRALNRYESAVDQVDKETYLDVRRRLSRALLVSASQDVERYKTRLETLYELNARKEELETQLSHQLLPVDGQVPPRDASPKELLQELPENAVLVDYVRYHERVEQPGSVGPPSEQDARLLAFVLVPGHPVVAVPLGNAEPVALLAKRWREAIREGRNSEEGEELRQLVWDPVSCKFPKDIQSVYIAPDDALSFIPWNALPLADHSRLLIEQYAVATVPHGLFLCESLRRETDANVQGDKVLSVGDLDYGQRSKDEDHRAAGLKQVLWRRLPGSDKELKGVATAAGNKRCVRLTGMRATTDTVIKLLPTCRWAHFATHGFFVDHSLRHSLNLAARLKDGQVLSLNQSRTALLRRNPFVRSGLALSGANRLGKLDEFGVPREMTGILTAETIATIDCSGLQLAVLSACESGRGDVVHGDGVFGIQTAFHVAGARNVIASLWKIDDRATADLMSVFYRNLWEQDMTPLAALRAAQLKSLRQWRKSRQGTRGPDLGKSVPLPKGGVELPPSTIRDWAGFMLSGPGF
ncbi:MAG: CHAT domain-containing tetratricopeptide repeat protein [Pirellulaceae bacterium]